MDYDDNDFQGQNLNLAGEASLKICPVLRPYAIPKFDFDDSLRGHLRFDSLVENEGFLGIPSQDDNHWIEDFSRGSSGIEFDSGATESCSISRHNNVWLEATSSESVEMLLKSVGQEERVVRESILEEPDCGDESGNLSNPMESKFKQDEEKNHAKHSASAPEEHVSVVGLGPNLYSDEVESSRSELGSAIVSENYEEKREPNSDDVSQEVIDNMVNGTVSDEMPDPSVGKSECADTETFDDLNDQDNQQLVSEIAVANANPLPVGVWRSVEKQDIMDTTTRIDGQIPSTSAVGIFTHSVDTSFSVASKLEFADTQVVEISISDVKVPTSSHLEEGCGPHVTDGSSANMSLHEPPLTSKREGTFSCNLSENNNRVVDNTLLDSTVVIPGDGGSEVRAAEVDSTGTEITNHPEVEMNSLVQITHVKSNSIVEKENITVTDEEDRGALVSSSASLMVSVSENKRFEQGDVSSTDHVSGDSTSVMTSSSSDEMFAGNIVSENLKIGSDAHDVAKEESNAKGHVEPSILSGSVQNHEKKLSFELDEAHMDRDVSAQEAGSPKLSSESSDMECKVVEVLDSPTKLVSMSSGEGNGDIVEAKGSDSYTNNETEPALKETNFNYDKTLEAQVLSGSNSSTDISINHDDEPKSPILGLSHQVPDDKEGMDLPREASSLNGTSQASIVPDPILEDPTFEVKERTPADCAGKVRDEMDDQCAPMDDDVNQSEQAAVALEVGQGGTDVMEASAVPSDSSVKEGAENENPKETNIETNDRVQHLPGLTDDKPNDHQASVDSSLLSNCDADKGVQEERNSAMLDKHGCDSPTAISCAKIVHSAKDNHEQGKNSMQENTPRSEVTDNVEEKVQSISQNLCENDSSKEDQTFTFKVSPSLSLGDAGKVCQSFATIPASNLPMIADGSASKSVAGQVNPKIAQEVPQCSPQATVDGKIKGGTKGTTERKARRKSGGKESAKKKIDVKETSFEHPGRSEKTTVSLDTTGTGQVLHFEELKSSESVEPDAKKPSCVVSIPASSLPDLNTSVSLSQQPFTDMQQVQLRAQILVYGSLIQGTTPEETCMIAAFGPSDGGRNPWEAAWRLSIERLQGQKPQANKGGTPVLLPSGITTPDQAVKRGSVSSVKSKVPSSTTGRAIKKKGTGTPSPVINPMIPLSSPLWNISTPSGENLQLGSMARGAPLEYHQAFSHLHPYQIPPMQNFVGHNPSWLTQGPISGQWIAATPTSPFNVSGQVSTLPFTESVKLTPVKESAARVTKHTPPIPLVYAGGSSVFEGASSLPDLKKPDVSFVLPAGDSKSRKRKKILTSEPVGQLALPGQTQTELGSAPVIIGDLSKKVESHGQSSFLAQRRTESVSIPVVNNIFSTSVAVSATKIFDSKSTPEKFPSAVSPAPSNNQPNDGDQNAEEKVIVSEEALNKVEESKVFAEEAAKHAASAINHCQGVWTHLERQKNYGLASDVEVRLASAAVAIAAAASVAKAAAAAAKIALNAAEQARLMADEVLLSSGSGDFSQSRVISFPNAANDNGKDTPASILKGGDVSSNSSSIIVTAREASKRRLEAASAASKHAENLDAIVKAAELAAEAVSQAGKIVAMGEPLSLSKLVTAGPEGYWKTPQPASKQLGVTSDNVNSHKSSTLNTEADLDASAKPGPSDMEIETLKHSVPLGGVSDLIKEPTKVVDGIIVSKTSNEKEIRGLRTDRVSDASKTIGVVPESESSVQNENKITSGILEENIIKEGSLVEVFKDGDNFRGAWFAANVLNLKDGKAYLCYTELESDEGELKEWVTLEGDGINLPRIRIAHPMTTMNFEGTRKRRRGALMDYSWNVGDRVDAWLHNSWCEGIITEKDKNDETSLTIHFPAQGKTSVIRAWHLRPTLIWKDKKWVEWSSSKGNYSSQGDTPKEKRLKLSHSELRGKQKVPVSFIPDEKQPKLGPHTVEGLRKDRDQTSVDHVASRKHEEARLLPLSAHETEFNVGKTTKVEKKPESQRTVRSGLQKEGPRVVFGVPKPGKKQKYMDVSKHYNGDRGDKNDSTNDSSKLSRFLMPQTSGPRGWSNNFKNDNKEKQSVEMKSRVLKTRKESQNPSGRTFSSKDNNLSSAKFAPTKTTMAQNVVTSSASNDQNESGEHNVMDYKSSSNTSESLGGNAEERVFLSKARSERSNRARLASAGGKSAKQDANDQSGPEIAEPRRSIRRIQPTSRLLEGLQSSLTIAKLPAISHSRSHRGQNKAAAKGK